MSCNYSIAASTAYKNMVICFGDPKCSDYWKLGNAFDSMTDYLRWWRIKDIALPGIVYTRYKALTDPNSIHRTDCWYDDYGWWGIASAKAYDPAYSFFFYSDYQQKFQTIAQDCWRTMNVGKPGASWSYKGAPNVWTNRDNGNPDNNYWNQKGNWATPRFNNGVGSGLQGVWQYDIFHETRLNECSPSNPCDPNSQVLGPYQNTVVNALYFLLALRLYNVGKDQTTRQPILDEYGFLRAWFSKALGDDSLLLLFGDTSVPPAALVRERVTSYAEIDGEYPPVKYFNKHPDSCWGGDQGLIIAALVEVLQMFHDPTAADTALSILKGVVTRMIDQNSKVLQPYYGGMGDLPDYKCGEGIFARCLLYAYSQPNSPLKPVIDNNKDDIRAVLLASANDVCNRKPLDLFDNLNVLSILTAAKVLGVIQVQDTASEL